ncbi:MAG: hypothetical protein LBC97_01155 [Bifidobacteriaceae bacterium]|jgi:hypothetical protein|nr:hypothetical protein [Bifidobacteriaceae bacterium]
MAVFGVVVMVGGLLSVGVWRWGKNLCLWSPDVPFEALLDDPLASRELLDLELVSSSEQRGYGMHNLGIERVCMSTVRRLFEPGPDGPEATARQIVRFAQDNGWEVQNDRRPDGEGVHVSMSKPWGARGYEIRAAVFASESGDGDERILVDVIW